MSPGAEKSTVAGPSCPTCVPKGTAMIPREVWEGTRVGGCQRKHDSSAFLLSDLVGAVLEEDTDDALLHFVQQCKMVSCKPVPQAEPPYVC